MEENQVVPSPSQGLGEGEATHLRRVHLYTVDAAVVTRLLTTYGSYAAAADALDASYSSSLCTLIGGYCGGFCSAHHCYHSNFRVI